jgi:hypothetical protein
LLLQASRCNTAYRQRRHSTITDVDRHPIKVQCTLLPWTIIISLGDSLRTPSTICIAHILCRLGMYRLHEHAQTGCCECSAANQQSREPCCRGAVPACCLGCACCQDYAAWLSPGQAQHTSPPFVAAPECQLSAWRGIAAGVTHCPSCCLVASATSGTSYNTTHRMLDTKLRPVYKMRSAASRSRLRLLRSRPS